MLCQRTPHLPRKSGPVSTGGSSNQVLAIGASAGGMRALEHILCEIPKGLEIPILITQHIAQVGSGLLAEIVGKKCGMSGKEAEDKETIVPGMIYFAPPNYHLLVERTFTLALSVDEKVKYSRPSIDVLFDSVAHAYGANATAIILTGANDDGSQGIVAIKKSGGCTIAQDPSSAEYPVMPQSAINTGMVDFVIPLHAIAPFVARHVIEKRQPTT